MKRKIVYSDEAIGDVEVVADFLPSPAKLAFREGGVKVTLALSKSSVDFFKSEASKHHTRSHRKRSAPGCCSRPGWNVGCSISERRSASMIPSPRWTAWPPSMSRLSCAVGGLVHIAPAMKYVSGPNVLQLTTGPTHEEQHHCARPNGHAGRDSAAFQAFGLGQPGMVGGAATLVHKDPEFVPLDLPHLKLPFET